jgi:hypothetical protein
MGKTTRKSTRNLNHLISVGGGTVVQDILHIPCGHRQDVEIALISSLSQWECFAKHPLPSGQAFVRYPAIIFEPSEHSGVSEH